MLVSVDLCGMRGVQWAGCATFLLDLGLIRSRELESSGELGDSSVILQLRSLTSWA